MSHAHTYLQVSTLGVKPIYSMGEHVPLRAGNGLATRGEGWARLGRTPEETSSVIGPVPLVDVPAFVRHQREDPLLGDYPLRAHVAPTCRQSKFD